MYSEVMVNNKNISHKNQFLPLKFPNIFAHDIDENVQT